MAHRQRLQVKTVGIIGAGVSGVASAIHLRKAGLQITVFERNSHVGGVWYIAKAFLSSLHKKTMLTLDQGLRRAHFQGRRVSLY